MSRWPARDLAVLRAAVREDEDLAAGTPGVGTSAGGEDVPPAQSPHLQVIDAMIARCDGSPSIREHLLRERAALSAEELARANAWIGYGG